MGISDFVKLGLALNMIVWFINFLVLIFVIRFALDNNRFHRLLREIQSELKQLRDERPPK